MVVVAHRLQTVKEADRILVMEDGGVIESGTHAELTAKGGEYSRMVDLQDGSLRQNGENVRRFPFLETEKAV